MTKEDALKLQRILGVEKTLKISEVESLLQKSNKRVRYYPQFEAIAFTTANVRTTPNPDEVEYSVSEAVAKYGVERVVNAYEMLYCDV